MGGRVGRKRAFIKAVAHTHLNNEHAAEAAVRDLAESPNTANGRSSHLHSVRVQVRQGGLRVERLLQGKAASEKRVCKQVRDGSNMDRIAQHATDLCFRYASFLPRQVGVHETLHGHQLPQRSTATTATDPWSAGLSTLAR